MSARAKNARAKNDLNVESTHRITRPMKRDLKNLEARVYALEAAVHRLVDDEV